MGTDFENLVMKPLLILFKEEVTLVLALLVGSYFCLWICRISFPKPKLHNDHFCTDPETQRELALKSMYGYQKQITIR
jgi:hypothetical protein